MAPTESGLDMPKFLIQGSYTSEGAKGLMAEGGSARLAAGTAACESVGGTVESFYFAYGDTDVIGIWSFQTVGMHRLWLGLRRVQGLA